jgi:hypothetical protein
VAKCATGVERTIEARPPERKKPRRRRRSWPFRDPPVSSISSFCALMMFSAQLWVFAVLHEEEDASARIPDKAQRRVRALVSCRREGSMKRRGHGTSRQLPLGYRRVPSGGGD